jgi:hypothetical protein
MYCRLLMGRLLADADLQAWAHGRFDDHYVLLFDVNMTRASN